MAVVRPPGHHAEQHCCAGFCLFNNIAIAAKWAKENRGVKKSEDILSQMYLYLSWVSCLQDSYC